MQLALSLQKECLVLLRALLGAKKDSSLKACRGSVAEEARH